VYDEFAAQHQHFRITLDCDLPFPGCHDPDVSVFLRS